MIPPDPIAPTSNASRATASAQGVSLNECARILKETLGEAAPARITLHRHSARGDLKSLIVRRSKSRPLYDAAGMVEHYRKQIPSQAAEPKAADPDLGLLDRHTVEELSERLVRQATQAVERQLQQALGPIQESLNALAREVSQLPAVKQSLMLKYDAVTTMQQQRLERAEADLKDARFGSSNIEQKIMRMSIDLSKISDAVTRLASASRSSGGPYTE